MADDEIARLEARIDELESRHHKLQEQLDQARIDQWQGRIDDLEVQAKLGSMELSERIDPLVERLRNTFLDAKEQASKGSGTAGDVFDALRSGVESAVDDLRSAIGAASKAATGG